MENPRNPGARPEVGSQGTHDLASPADRAEAIDLAMRHYFQTGNWPAARDKQFPGLRHSV